jgi:hypothetical protein
LRDLGLRKVLKEGESVPEMFEDPVVKRASHWVLSTSALYSKHLREYGWGEVRLFLFPVPDVFVFSRVDVYSGGTRWLWRGVHDRM